MNRPDDSIVCSLEIHTDIQKRTINAYKEKLVNFLEKRNKEDKELRNKYHKSKDEIMFHYLCGEYDFSEKLIRLIKQGEFDND